MDRGAWWAAVHGVTIFYIDTGAETKLPTSIAPLLKKKKLLRETVLPFLPCFCSLHGLYARKK